MTQGQRQELCVHFTDWSWHKGVATQLFPTPCSMNAHEQVEEESRATTNMVSAEVGRGILIGWFWEPAFWAEL